MKQEALAKFLADARAYFGLQATAPGRPAQEAVRPPLVAPGRPEALGGQGMAAPGGKTGDISTRRWI